MNTNDWRDNWIFTKDGKWYFYDPENEEYGPYESREQAKEKLEEFAKDYERE